MDLGLTGKKALVMASSQGLGKAIAAELIKEGADVMMASRSPEKLERAADELEKQGGGSVQWRKADITNPTDIKKLVAETAHAFGHIDILVNNAGGPPGGGFREVSDQDWQQAFELNLLSYVRVIRAVLPHMEERGGRIINIASSSVKEPIANLVLSNTFRTGIVGLTKTLAEELAPDGIFIHTVAPGRFATDRVRHLDQLKAEREGVTEEAIKRKSEQQIPLGRYGRPEEFAKVVAFLVSEACTYMTGNSLLVDGGMIKAI